MEDENWIDLRLGLPCGGPSSKSKVNDVSSDPKAEEGNGNRLMGGNMDISDVSFKHFFQTGLGNEGCKGQQNSDLVSRQHENFWTDLGKCSAPVSGGSSNVHDNVSQFTRYQELWVSSNKATDSEEEKAGLNKRKLPFEDIDLERKHDRLVDYVDTRGKSPSGAKKNSLVSLNIEDGSSGENEGITESHAEDYASRLLSQHEDNAKCLNISKFIDEHILPDPSRIGSQGQKHPCVSGNDSNLELGKLAHGITMPLQPVTVMTVPYPVPVKVPAASSAPIRSGLPSPYVKQLMPPANSEHAMVQTMDASNLHLASGYSSVHLPMLETDSSMVSQSKHVSSLTSRGQARVPNSDHSEDGVKISHAVTQVPRTSSVALPHEGKSSDLAQGRGKHVEESSACSSRIEDDKKGNNARPKETRNQLAGEWSEGSAIRPGIAPNVTFGGFGSFPDLPWVSTTGPGPNGKTISGVSYKCNINQIKIVCACHGSHMSPEEFIQHASADGPPDNNTTVVSQ